jgi:Protein of unknown function (DUF3810)
LPRAVLALQGSAVALAAGLLFLPLPAAAIERYYADGAYLSIQSALTSWSNLTAFSLFDVLALMFAGAIIIAWARTIRTSWRRRSLRLVVRAAMTTLTAASVGYLWFALVWGLNYARTPLEDAIGYDGSRISASALQRLAERAATEVNRTHAAAHATGFPEVGDTPAPLVRSLHAVERRLGRPAPTIPGRPKRTLLIVFFRAAGVDGMHAPFLLETLLNRDLTPAERPAVLAHEWAHLAGYAPEDDASFVGLLAALRADSASQYSAWLALFEDTVSQLPAPDRQRLVAQLQPGPQADRQAIRDRLATRVDLVARASWQTYDHYLKSQGVREGVRSYSRVVQLILGSGALEWD